MNQAKTTPKDFFLHLGATVALYVAAVALINLSFSVINYAVPDKLAGYFYVGSVAWPISMLVVLVPILYGVEWLIARDISRTPEKKDIWIRRWRIYLTIFLAVILLGGDLIALLNTYFSGEITARFVYKILVIILVAGAIGKYYFFSIFDTYRRATLARRVNAWFGIVLVVAAIIGGFLIVGSPATQRALRFDQQRVNDLTNLQWQMVNYWQQKGHLPSALTDLNDSISGFAVPKDPETAALYEYISLNRDPQAFALCADFSRPSEDLKGRGAYNGSTGMSYPEPAMYPGYQADSWNHDAGHVCFQRTIDPSRYPVNKPILQK